MGIGLVVTGHIEVKNPLEILNHNINSGQPSLDQSDQPIVSHVTDTLHTWNSTATSDYATKYYYIGSINTISHNASTPTVVTADGGSGYVLTRSTGGIDLTNIESDMTVSVIVENDGVIVSNKSLTCPNGSVVSYSPLTGYFHCTN